MSRQQDPKQTNDQTARERSADRLSDEQRNVQEQEAADQPKSTDEVQAEKGAVATKEAVDATELAREAQKVEAEKPKPYEYGDGGSLHHWPAAAAAQEGETLVRCTVPTSFDLTLNRTPDAGGGHPLVAGASDRVRFEAPECDVPESLLDHPYVVANGVRPVKQQKAEPTPPARTSTSRK